MKRLLILCSFLFSSIVGLSQTQTIQITGPSATSGPVIVTLEINAPTTCSVAMLPASITINTNGTQQFTATTIGCSPSTVFYQVNGVTGGDATNGTINGSGLYTAPAAVPFPATVTVAAISNADNTKTANSSVTIVTPPPPCSVSVTPGSAVLMTNATQQYTATTIGCSPSTVTWNVNGVVGGNSTVGTVSGTGLYTAPANVPTPSVVTITAVSNADNTKISSGTANITAPPVCSVSITPQQFTVNVNATDQFSVTTVNCTPATVTWSVNNINGGNSTVGTISGSGLYTAPATVPSPATVTVKAVSNADATKSASSSITVTTVAIAGNDKYCSLGDIPSFGISDDVALLPDGCMFTGLGSFISNGTVRTITAATWNSVWAASQCGDVIEQLAGSTIVINGTVPSKVCTNGQTITYRTSGYASLPPYGTRVNFCYWGVTSRPGYPVPNCTGIPNIGVTIIGATTAPTLSYTANTTYIKWLGVHFTRPATGGMGRILKHEVSGLSHIYYAQSWCDGSLTAETTRCHEWDGGNNIGWTDGMVTEMHCIGATCAQSQSFVGGFNNMNNVQDYNWKVVNMFLSSAGNTTFGYGGGAANTTPKNGEFRNNWGYKLPTWNPADPTYSHGINNTAFQVINCWETKNSDKVLVEGNVFQYNWVGANQNGSCILITPKNQSAGTSNICPKCLVTNTTVRYNKIRYVNYPYQVANAASDAGGYAVAGNSYSLHDNVTDGVGYSTCFHCATNAGNAENGGDISGTNAPVSDILFNVHEVHDTIVLVSGAPPKGGTLGISGPLSPTKMSSFNFKDSLLLEQNVGINNPSDGCNQVGNNNCACGNSNPTTILNACFSSYVVTGNAFIAHKAGNVWPGVNCTTEPSYASIFVNYNNGVNGDYHIKNTSPCHNSSSTGTDPGANIDKVNTMTQGVDTF